MNVTIDQWSVTYRVNDHALLALDQVNLSLLPGRITALVGESGSGKTTLGKSLMGLLPEYAEVKGHIRLDEEEMAGAREDEWNAVRWSRIAMLFQNGPANLNPVHRILDQVAGADPTADWRRESSRSAADERGTGRTAVRRVRVSTRGKRRNPA